MKVIAKEPFKAQEVGDHIGCTGQDVTSLILDQDWKGVAVVSQPQNTPEVLYEFYLYKARKGTWVGWALGRSALT